MRNYNSLEPVYLTCLVHTKLLHLPPIHHKKRTLLLSDVIESLLQEQGKSETESSSKMGDGKSGMRKNKKKERSGRKERARERPADNLLTIRIDT